MMRESPWLARASSRAHVARFLGVLLLAATLAACGTTSSHTPGATPTPSPTASPSPTAPASAAHGWNAASSPSVSPEGRLSAVAARSASDAWAVGSYEGTDGAEHTLVEHWDGAQWTTRPSANPGKYGNSLIAVAEIAANDVWVLGAQSTSTQTTSPLIEHFNGSAWSVAAMPSFGASSVTLSSIAGSSANDLWAVGISSTTGAQNTVVQLPLFLHWNGNVWSIITGATLPSPQPGSSYFAQLSGVVALAPSNAWAVGSYSTQIGQLELIEHWNGSKWSIVSGAPPGPSGQNVLSAISADSANDVWAVGSGPLASAQGCGIATAAIVERWNGSRWISVPPLTPPAQQNEQFVPFSLASVAAVAPNNVWAVGGLAADTSTGYTSTAPVIEHWNGANWSIVSSPNLAMTFGLEGVAAASGTAWAVGQLKATNGAGPTLIEQLSGGQWATVTSASPGTVANQLNGVATISSSDAWAVGESAAGTLAEHWDGAQWDVAATPNGPLGTNMLNGVAAVSANDVWAVGEQPVASSGSALGASGALIEHWDGSAWATVSAPAKAGPLTSVSAVSASDIWAVGNSTLLHWNGTTWATTALPSASSGQFIVNDYFGVVAIASNNVWAVGGNPPVSCGGAVPVTIAHWNGHAWSLVPNTPQGLLYAVSASGAKDIWAVGLSNLVMHFNGTKWSMVSGASGQTYAGAALRGVVALSATDAWAVAEGASAHVIIEHWNGTLWSGTQATGPGLGNNSLLAVAADSAADIWAVGYFSAVATYGSDLTVGRQALIEHYTP